MFLKWLPWKYVVGRAARAFGFIDPVMVLARLRQFSQPSEIQEPIELVRAGVVFQARGLINTRVIQFNLDWVWPFWVEKQFNPRDASFIPRAFSFSHINLTHRNWTAVGHPDVPIYPLVDPRGLITPLFDGWSLDFWILSPEGDHLLPSKLAHVFQEEVFDERQSVRTVCRTERHKLVTEAFVESGEGGTCLEIRVRGSSTAGGWIAASVRPYNPEGISFVEDIEFHEQNAALVVDHEAVIEFGERPEKVLFSSYRKGDVFHRMEAPEERLDITCGTGMATAAAFFPVEAGTGKDLELRIPLDDELKRACPDHNRSVANGWRPAMKGTARLSVPDEKFRRLYESALRTLVLLSAREIYPGPYNYRRFWFRDACLMMNALLAAGFTDRVRGLLEGFPGKQKRNGYFLSQEGEWDSNGQVLWIMDRFHRLTGEVLKSTLLEAALKGARWIAKKRTWKGEGGRHDGLLPPGFSAEHFGTNDYYYWDDFWSIAGLRGAARLFDQSKHADPEPFIREADSLERAVMESIHKIPTHTSHGGIPASPYRRMDAGAVGCLVADYPLQLMPAGHGLMRATLEYLLENCMFRGGFFQDMVHSGINVYLTLSVAQSLLRLEDSRFRRLVDASLDLASPTGQWPEAVHPLTGGGCMGDGQHGWAAAEWVMFVRNMFVREEGDKLILGSGLDPEWLRGGSPIHFGPTPTPFGSVDLRITQSKGSWSLEVRGEWRSSEPEMEVRIPGIRRARVNPPGPGSPEHHTVTLKPPG